MNFTIKNMSFVIPLSVAAIGLASPAIASRAPDRSANASEMSGVQTNGSSASSAAKKNASNKICISMPALTGSRMPTRKCKSKAEWETLGYELSEKK